MKDKKTKRKFIEVSGKTLDQAIKKAAQLLSVPREMLDVTLLSEEEKGLFGMQGSQPAKIRVTIKQDAPKKG
jgi:spoIIIJ-associated protein